MNLEKGEADLEGQVDSLTYSASGHKKKKRRQSAAAADELRMSEGIRQEAAFLQSV